MKHSGKAFKAALRIIFWTLVLLVALFAAGKLATLLGSAVIAVSSGLITLWLLFVLFTLYFFRDPDPTDPADPNAVVAPGQGKVDVIDETTEADFMGGPCKRVSIFLSVFDVHVQRSPVTGQMIYHKYTEGEFISATRADCGTHNENALLGFVTLGNGNQKVGLRLIAGLIARRINVWAAAGEKVTRGERISLIQFGSRTDIYLPLNATIRVKLGDRVKVGESVIATLP